MPLPKLHTENRYTYADYLAWTDDERWELIDGVTYAMSPAPGTQHQRISRILTRTIDTHLIGKTCELFASPYDVRFAEKSSVSDNYIDTVVQPDLLVVCDKSKLDERGCNGAPDLIIEILSPSSAAHDLKTKFELYQRYGVKEYWIIHPAEKTLLVYRLEENGSYGAPDRYCREDKVAVPLLGELEIDLKSVFAE